MPTSSQHLLKSRRANAHATSPRRLLSERTSTAQSFITTYPVNVQFPKLYFDARYGPAQFSGEYEDIIRYGLGYDIDKQIKECYKRGRMEIHIPIPANSDALPALGDSMTVTRLQYTQVTDEATVRARDVIPVHRRSVRVPRRKRTELHIKTIRPFERSNSFPDLYTDFPRQNTRVTNTGFEYADDVLLPSQTALDREDTEADGGGYRHEDREDVEDGGGYPHEDREDAEDGGGYPHEEREDADGGYPHEDQEDTGDDGGYPYEEPECDHLEGTENEQIRQYVAVKEMRYPSDTEQEDMGEITREETRARQKITKAMKSITSDLKYQHDKLRGGGIPLEPPTTTADDTDKTVHLGTDYAERNVYVTMSSKAKLHQGTPLQTDSNQDNTERNGHPLGNSDISPHYEHIPLPAAGLNMALKNRETGENGGNTTQHRVLQHHGHQLTEYSGGIEPLMAGEMTANQPGTSMPIRRKGRRSGNEAGGGTVNVEAIHVQSYQQHDVDTSDVTIQLNQSSSSAARGSTLPSAPQRSSGITPGAGHAARSATAADEFQPRSLTSPGRDPVSDKLMQVSTERRLKQLEPPVMHGALPASRPLTVCFDVTGTSATHKQVLRSLMDTIEHLPEARVCSVQFGARNVMLGTMWVDNRWIIDVSTKQCVNVLIGRGIQFNREPIKLRRYDDVIREEFDKFQQYLATKKPSKKAKAATTQAVPQSERVLNAMDLLKSSEQAKSTIDDVTSQMQAIRA